MRLRFSIRGLMAQVLFVGVGFAALRYATDWWASGLFTATLIGLALAALYAVNRRGASRAFWSAFVAFGAGYLILAFGPWCETSIRPRLLTTKLLDALFPLVHPANGAMFRLCDKAIGKPISSVSFSPDGKVLAWKATVGYASALAREHFQDIGHSLAALLHAVIGGMAARYFYAHRDERRREAAEKAAGAVVRVLEAGL